MGRRGPEGKIQDNVTGYAKTKYGALVKKNEGGKFFVSSGWPDVAIWPDRQRKKNASPFLMEFKAPGQVLTPLQSHMKGELEGRGYRVYVVDSAARGRMIVDSECS